MAYNLTQNEIDQIQAYKNNGNYPEAYRYISDLIGPHVGTSVNVSTQRWFDWAAQINGDDGGLISDYARAFSDFWGDVTPQEFQTASDAIAEDVLQRLIDTGTVPTTPESIILIDIQRGTELLDIDNEDFPGTFIGGILFDTDTLGNLILNDPGNAGIWSKVLAIAEQATKHIVLATGVFLVPQILFIEDLIALFQTAKANGSPLVLDLDGDGIELTDISTNPVYWDIDADGFAESSGWVTGGDGLLCIDLNEDGVINDNSELFGNVGGSPNGFAALDIYDTNNNNTITSADAQFGDLRVWIDANANGFSEEGELYTLGELLITSINTTYSTVSYSIAGNEIKQESSFVINGNTNDVVDAWFAYNDVYTAYSQPVALDESLFATFSLPTLQGYGEVPALHIAMSIDNNGADPDSLVSLVTALSEKTIGDLFGDEDATHDLVQSILYRWAGVDSVSSTSRGAYVNAQKLEFLEALMADTVGGNPAINAGPQFDEAFEYAAKHMYARLLAQTDAGQIFEGDAFYNLFTDSIDGITGLNLTALASFGDIADASNDPAGMWFGLVRMIEYTVGTANLDGGDYSALASEITNSGSNLSLTQILTALDTDHKQSINGTSSAETITGSGNEDYVTAGSGADTVYGLSGNDTIYGQDGNDKLYGWGGDDILDGGNNDDSIYGGDGDDDITGGAGANIMSGGAGDDELHGNTGNDIYIYDSGDDIFYEGSAGTDVIQMADGIVLGDLTSFIRTGTDLTITVDGFGTIKLDDNFYSSSYKFETIQFADTSTLALSSINFVTNGTNSAETINGVSTYGTTNDTIYALGGNDYVYGGDGNDTIYGGDGNDTLYGEAGNDFISGGNGNDWMQDTTGGNETYVYSGGHDTIYEYTGTDTLRVEGYTINDITVTDEGYHHLLSFSASDDIEVWYVDYSSDYQVETIEFSDGFSTTLTTDTSWTFGTSSGETLNGGSGADTLVGKAGNDTLNGNNGNDAMHGGSGNDTLAGGSGMDLLHGGTGDDTVGGGDGLDTLYGGDGADIFLFDSNAFNNQDVLKDFITSQSDKLDLHAILDAAFDPLSDAIADFVNFTNSGSDSIMSIDRDGTGGTYSFQNVATIVGITNLDETTLYGNGAILVA